MIGPYDVQHCLTALSDADAARSELPALRLAMALKTKGKTDDTISQ
jgi:hypothetical protein